jgi:AbrB family transcriptional regulator, transcriptional pleiotropic regulator of transition state genes
MGFKRKVDYTGRITLPSELCEKFDIKKDDLVDVSNNDEFILIKKYQAEFVCVITGKVTDQGKKIGNAFISNEGLKMLSKVIK